jgi:hypothetical protein
MLLECGDTFVGFGAMTPGPETSGDTSQTDGPVRHMGDINLLP